MAVTLHPMTQILNYIQIQHVYMLNRQYYLGGIKQIENWGLEK